MIIKKILVSVVAVGLLALSPVSFSNAGGDVDSYEDDAVFYLKGFYNGSLVHKTTEIEGAKISTSDTNNYQPEYELNKLGGGGAIGWAVSGMRIEGEVFTSTKIKTKDDSNTFASNSKTYRNKGFKHITGTINGIYDLALSDEITPYVGIGVGASYATFISNDSANNAIADDVDLTAWHISFQGKAGVALNISKSFVPYVGYRALWMLEKEYGDLKTSTTGDNSTIKPKISHFLHNLEAGVMIPIVA